MIVENTSELKERIERLKREKNAVILAHYYTRPEVQAVADFLGDSLALSVRAQSVDADVILFAGVHFMAETAKVLCPEKKVLIPCPEAGCSLADSCPAAEFAAFKAKYPGHRVVSYVNTTVGVKALTDICCTSSNALKVVESIPADVSVLFGPDRNLGSYIRKLTGRTNMVLWDGACTRSSRSRSCCSSSASIPRPGWSCIPNAVPTSSKWPITSVRRPASSTTAGAVKPVSSLW